MLLANSLRAVSACALLALLMGSGCARSGGAQRPGIVWGSFGPNGGIIEGANADGSGRGRVVTDYGDSEGDPAWSRDGQAIAFYARNSDTVEIHVLWPKTKRHRVLVSDWRSPAEPRRSFAYLLEPSWAPDGDHIAVSDSWNGPATAAATIRVVSASTGDWVSLTRPDAHQADTEPAWSPDGRTIAFVRHRDLGRRVIFVIAQDGRGLRRLAEGWSPSWSPDGASIAFASGDGIYRIGSNGTPIQVISRVKAEQVRWSPDGRHLLYTTVSSGAQDAWITDRDGSNPIRVLRHETINGIAWRPASSPAH